LLLKLSELLRYSEGFPNFGQSKLENWAFIFFSFHPQSDLIWGRPRLRLDFQVNCVAENCCIPCANSQFYPVHLPKTRTNEHSNIHPRILSLKQENSYKFIKMLLAGSLLDFLYKVYPFELPQLHD